jgi:hypothetical protein
MFFFLHADVTQSVSTVLTLSQFLKHFLQILQNFRSRQEEQNPSLQPERAC